MGKRNCKWGRLKSPVLTSTGGKRHCKLAPKTVKGKSQDRKKKSGEYHERQYRRRKK